jgi:phage terminase Nu1 subunit (DNA packaging protein)
MEDNAARIQREVSAWEGVSVRPHRFGGVEFVFGNRDLGHLHGSRWADIRFHRTVGAMLVETGRASQHHVLPDTGWVSHQIRNAEDAGEVVELFRLAYERARVVESVNAARRER